MDNQPTTTPLQSPNSSTLNPSTPSTSLPSEVGQLLSRTRISAVAREIDPTVIIDDDAEEMLAQMTLDFIDNVLQGSCRMAKHRNSTSLDVKDVKLYLEQKHKMYIPGYGVNDMQPNRRLTPLGEAHSKRMALVRKTLKRLN